MGSEKVFTPAPSPESLGIPSQAILNFLHRIDSERICMHGFLLVRHNQIAAEGYWPRGRPTANTGCIQSAKALSRWPSG